MTSEAERLEEVLIIEEHWQFIAKWLKMAFYDGWIHGAKHTRERLEK